MQYTFKPLTAFSLQEITDYASLRPIYASEGQFMNQFVWADYYQTEYCRNDHFMFYKMVINNETATMMPYCKTENIVESFLKIKEYFNHDLKLPLKLYLADDLFLNTLQSEQGLLDDFEINEDRDCFDYIYDADKLKMLSGKKYHKKKNHVNSFLNQYAGRYEYRTLNCTNMEEIKLFHGEWLSRKIVERVNTIKSEETGIYRLFKNCPFLDCRMGGIYIDGKLEAYSVGSFTPHLKCAFIHVEKANVEIKGLYNYINQQFLINEFSDAIIVNREDDLGQEGLRKAKLSYHPTKLEAKYNLIQKN